MEADDAEDEFGQLRAPEKKKPLPNSKSADAENGTVL